MITIKEDTPKKLSGVTSLFLSFDFNQKIIDQIKTCPVYSYDKKSKVWEVSILSLAYLLDSLTLLDDITLELKNAEETKETLTPILSYRTKPFPYQLDGIKYGLQKPRWLLLDTMGLGKTLQLIYLAEELKAQKKIEHCLIICGVASLRTNWKKEIEKHSSLTCRILGEKISRNGTISYTTIDERAKELEEDIDEFFIICNIESWRDKKDPESNKVYSPLVKAFERSRNKIDMIVVDECHKIKDKNSQAGSNLLKISAPYMVAATGTLLLNNPLDAYVPLAWTKNDHATLTNFKQQYCVFGGFGGHEIVGFKNIDLLKDELDHCSLRRTKDLLNLPPKTIVNEYVDMNADQAKFYKDVVRGVKEECDKIELKASNVLALTTRLRQASILPSILTSQNISSSKIDRCVDMVEELIEQGEKVVVMSTFKEPIAVLSERLAKYNPLICIGDTKDADIERNKELFQEDDEHMVMLATWQKMGTGHTLNRASSMIFLDTPWTYALFDQTCDRIHRIGSKKPVFIYNLIATNTIDETVSKILELKQAISDFIVDDKMSDKGLEILRKYIEDL